MAQVNIKPNRIKFIKALEDSIKRIETKAKEYEVALKQYEKDYEVWRSSGDFSPENIKSSVIYTKSYDDKPYEVKVVLKKWPTGMPKKPTEPELYGWQKRDALAEMTSIIAMLKLTDEDVVSASVANKVARYL